MYFLDKLNLEFCIKEGTVLDNKDIDRALRREAIKEKRERYKKPLLMFGLIVIGLLIMFLISPKQIKHQSELIQGRTLKVIPASESYGYNSAMIVLLGNGQEARVPIMKDVEFIEDKIVEVKKISSKDTITYEFSRYVNE